MKKSIVPVAFLLLLSLPLFSQTTFDRVYQILQANCTTCHSTDTLIGGGLAGNMNLTGSKQDVLNALINVAPENDNAEAAGYKRIVPGDARRSFLFRKISQGLDVNVDLPNGFGAAMPKDAYPLSEVEREMIRQWIIFGAEDSVYPYANEALIDSFYNGHAEARTIPLALPNPSEGYQVYYGPIFLRPGVEVEFDGLFKLHNPIDVEVHKMNVEMNKESHHMAVFKYHAGEDSAVFNGLKKVNNIGDAAALFYSAEVVAQWPNSLEVELPAGTALMWNSNAALSVSYHILNYSDSIIAAELYYNIYTRPKQTGTIPMVSYPVRYDGHPVYQGGWDVFNLILPPSSDTNKLEITQYSPDSAFYWNLWSIQAHTHKLGASYFVYERNPDGTKGEILYDGRYNPEYTFNQGFYDWEHPPLRYFDPPRSIDQRIGMIHEAGFINDTGDTVGFGLKTTDEMFVSYIFFTKTEHPVGIVPGRVFNDTQVKTYPNPVQQQAWIQIGPDVQLKQAQFRVYDMLGKEVLTADNLKDRQFTLNTKSLADGTYFYRLVNDGKVASTGKLVVQQ